jgi:hypothetical protein
MTTALTTTATDLALPPGFITPAAPVALTPIPLTPVPVAPDRLLPVRQHDGNPITHLSKSSFETFSACPDFRRRYVLGQTFPSAPRMVLGNMVDGALTWLAQQRIADRHPEQGDLRAYYLKQAIPAALAHERLGVAWTDGERLEDLRVLGWKAILAYQREVAPLIGRAQSAQRKMQFKLTPTATWVVRGFLDLEVVPARRSPSVPRTAA